MKYLYWIAGLTWTLLELAANVQRMCEAPNERMTNVMSYTTWYGRIFAAAETWIGRGRYAIDVV